MAEFPNSTETETQSKVLWCNSNTGDEQLRKDDIVTFTYHHPSCVKVTFPSPLAKTLFGIDTPVPIDFEYLGDRCYVTTSIEETGKDFTCSIQRVDTMGNMIFSGQYTVSNGLGNDEQSGGWGGQ